MAEETKPEGEKAAKKKTTGVAATAEETKPEGEKAPRRKLTKAEKQAQHTVRLKRTAIACFAGILAGVLSFVVDTKPPTGTALGILLLLAAIVFQKYVFLALRMDYFSLTAKDWLFQGFMTFTFWFITWTILISSA
jgi:EMC6-arch